MTDDLSKRVYDFINDIRGTCKDIMSAMEENFDGDEFRRFTQEEYRQHEKEINDMIDNAVFDCHGCGWIYEMGEMADNEDWVCTSCAED